MNIPEELNYSTTHEWLRLDGANATVGITDYAQREWGTISGVTLPKVGDEVLAAAVVGVLHSATGDREIHAPISGTVVAINEALTGAPGVIQTEPYEGGWIFGMSIEAGEEIEPLESAAQYRERVGGCGPAAMDL